MEAGFVGLYNIKEIFQNRVFRIPDYQRGYSWKEEHIIALWEDIHNLIENRASVHYTGMITVQSPSDRDIEKWRQEINSSDIKVTKNAIRTNSGVSLKPFYIADGQQRLTTIIILLAAIRDCKAFTSGQEIEANYLWQNFENLCLYLFGYEVDSPSYEFLSTRILRTTEGTLVNPATSYTENLRFAKNFFDRKVAAMNSYEVYKLYHFVINQLKFNYYELPRELNIFTVFETMNYRGKPLSNLELLKNRLIYLCSIATNIGFEEKERLRNKINWAWIKIYQTLAKNKDKILNDDEYLRVHWLLYFDHDKSNNKDLSRYKQNLLDEVFIKNNLFAENSNKNKISTVLIEDYVDCISHCVDFFFEMKFPGHSENRQPAAIRYWLAKVNFQYPKSYFEPLILAILAKREVEDKIVEFLVNVERYNFLVFCLAGLRSNTNKTPFLIEANKYFKRHKSLGIIIEKLKPEKQLKDKTLLPKEPAVKIENPEELLDDFYRDRQKDRSDEGFLCWKYVRYFFLEYEEYLQTGGIFNPYFSMSKYNLDLIFPPYINIPKKDKDKATRFKAYNEQRARNWESCMKGFGKETGQMYLCYTLGNIILTNKEKRDENPESFVEKKKRYENGTFSEQEVFQCDNWTPKQILERGLKLMSFIEKRWNIPIETSVKKQILYLNNLNIGDTQDEGIDQLMESPDLFSETEQPLLQISSHFS